MAILEGIAAGFLVAQYVYHRWIADKPREKRTAQEIHIPRVEEGAPIPLIFGRCRVRAPILAWHDHVTREAGDVGNGYETGSYVYRMNLFFVIGIAMDDGNGTSRVHGAWAGETPFSTWGSLPRETAITTDISGRDFDVGPIGLQAMWFDGHAMQDVGLTVAGTKMTTAGVNIFHIPAYRGYISAFFYNDIGQWYAGSSPSVPQLSFEVSSYHASHPQLSTYARVGSDSNPINVIYDVLAAKLGKLGIPTTLIDITNFRDTQYVLHTEQHGYSRAFEDFADADEIIQDVLRQIDGVLRENTTTGLVEIKLIRNDYDPNTIPHITKSNCDDITDFAMSGWSNLINRLRLVYPDRDNDYQDESAVDQNPANAVGQDGQVVEKVINMPGVCTAALARALVVREMAALSRPLMKFRALVDRSKIRVSVGDAVKVTWSNPDISGLVFRVANVDRGTLEDGKIALDLIQDYFYVYRGQAPRAPSGSFVSELDLAMG